jgi:hypothetical protein
MKFGSADKVILTPVTSSNLSDGVPSPLSTSASPSPPPESPPDVAGLSAVVLISSDDFWMTADAGYRGPGRYVRNFASVKPTCSGGIPDVEPFKSDYSEVVDNVRWLLDTVSTQGFHLKRGFVTGPTNAPRIKVQHVLFEVILIILLSCIVAQNFGSPRIPLTARVQIKMRTTTRRAKDKVLFSIFS